MGAFYDFLREDGEWVTKMFPFGQCPNEIVDDDGVKAKRGWRPGTSFNIGWKAGQEPSSVIISRREKRTRDNINAGKRGEKEWRARSPKFVID